MSNLPVSERQDGLSNSGLEFEQIYAEFQPKIQRYMTRMVGEYESEDLTHEVFVKVYQALKTFRGESEISTWIYRIATNAAFDRLRSPSHKKTINAGSIVHPTDDSEVEPIDRSNWTGEKTPLVEPQVYRKEMSDCILNFINKLPESYRTVIVLSEFEELSNNAIAEILGVKLDTIKIRLHRARAKLKESLAGNCGSEWVEGNEFMPELKREDLDYLNLK